MLISQQEEGQTIPLVFMASRQHWPLSAIQRGAEHSDMAIRPAPAAPARPSPPSRGARPAAPTVPPTPTACATAPLVARRAKPPGERVTIEIVCKRFRIFPENQILSLDLT